MTRLSYAGAALAVALTTFTGTPARLQAQGGETFTATATVKTAAGAAASAPVTIVIDRKMPESEVATLVSAFAKGGAAALRKALVGVPPTGSIRIGKGEATPARVTLERTTDKGRLLTIVTDRPILHLGAGLPGAKPREGYDFAVADLEIPASGQGTGTLSPAAKLRHANGALVVEDYGAESMTLSGVKKAR
ncbi:hypothetical protein TBR22_A00910 [Luteitalea sp. TBR-22]|uniref:hypothetical protein n=1 Tax=Luteitalea sp. TBR-22 TaxID=2802971 RepID=UPI001AF1E6A7|nr:hypothetical protein [Luteitalea sp. TBR-22]BCS30890.1 hypothetical protein TBR22_A00910 [Luteitalea sp. TBR-22]